jgi:hypothetical protein
MTSQLIDEVVSIYSLPTVDTTHIADIGAQITLGDLHGNAMKLIFMLVRHGVILNLTAAQYAELALIYQTNVDALTSEILKRFDEILSGLQFNKAGTIRLLGDEFADRGSNDYFTLKIIESLQKQQVPLEIILSNHGVEFIAAYETKLRYLPSVMESHFVASMVNLQILLSRQLVSREGIRSIIRDAYKPVLKAISYTLSQDNSCITIYSHAAIDLRAVRALTKKIGTSFDDSTAVALAKTIEMINQKYQVHVMNNTVHTLYDSEVMNCGYEVVAFPANMNAFEYIMWNRDLRFLNQPQHYKGYQMFFAHGHDSEISENANVFNLDNQLGKSLLAHTGSYTALYSHEHQLALTQRLSGGLFFGRTSDELEKDLEAAATHHPV